MANDVTRMNYFDGLFLKAEDFTLEQEYNISFRRLHNRYLHSPGIVTGLVVRPGSSPAKVIVSEGMALNRTMINGQEVSQEILLQQDQELDFSNYKPGDNIYITIAYRETQTDIDPLKGEKEYHIQELAALEPSLVKPTDPEQKLILARVTPDAADKGIVIAEKNIFDTDPDGTMLRIGAGTIGKTVETEKLTLDIPGERSNLPYITGIKQDNLNGLQVNSPLTRFSGAVTVEGELNVMGPVTTVNTQVLEVKDNIITLNKYKAQDTPKEINGGLEVFRGGKAPNAQIIWDETIDRWVIGTEGNLVDLAYGPLWVNLTKKAMADELHKHSQLADPGGSAALTVSPGGNVNLNGPLSVAGSLTPSAGNSEKNGIIFPKDPGGGSGDAAWLRYYRRADEPGDPCTLELGIANDPDDHIALMTSGNVGIGTPKPADKLDVWGNLRIFSNSNPLRFTASWQGFADAIDKTKINNAEISNDTSGYKTLMIVGNSSAGQGRRVSIWDRLEVNGSLIATGNVGIGTPKPISKLQVTGGDLVLSSTGIRGQVLADQIINTLKMAANEDGSYGAGIIAVQPANCWSDGVRLDLCTQLTNNANKLEPRLSIMAFSGNVGIGNNNPTYKLDVNGSMRVTGALTPSVGNSASNGIMFPKDPGGGSGDAAWIRYYPRENDKEFCTLELGTSDNTDDHITLMPSGNVGVKTPNPFQPLTVGARANGDGQGVMLRVVGDGPPNWKGGAAFGNTKATVIMGEVGGVATIGAHNADLTAWADLAINIIGNVGIGTYTPSEKLDVIGNVKVCNNANPIQFNSGHTGFVNGANNRAEIANDTGTYKTLMLLGNSSAGAGRRVSVWDSFWVNGAQRFDLAEVTPSKPEDRLEPGDVAVIDPDNGMRVKRSVKPGDSLVYGIVSSYEQAAMIIGGPVSGDIASEEDKAPIALVGRVKAKVSAEAGPIKVGDMLITSSTPGHLMRCAEPSRYCGAVAGKALEAWENGCGMITVLVTLQ